MSETERTSKWTVTVGGSEWGTVKYGVVEYLRKRPKMRAVTAITGLLWVGCWIASTAGFKWNLTLFPAISTFFVTPTLLWFAVVSGPEFSLKFPEPKAPETKTVPTKELSGVLDPDGYGIEALNKTYLDIEKERRSSFGWAIFALLSTITLVSCNVWMLYFGASKIGHYVPLMLWIFSSSLLLLSFAFAFRSFSASRRSFAIHGRLCDLQKTLIMIKHIEKSRTPPMSEDISTAKIFQVPTDRLNAG
jgi:hypothetical protein